MSVQSITVENNYELYCKNLNVVDEIDVSSMRVDEVYCNNIGYTDNGIDVTKISFDSTIPAQQNKIVVYEDVLPSASDGLDLGAATLVFRNLYCENLWGNNSIVNVQYGITGSSGTNPLNIANNGILFGNLLSIPTTPLTKYYEKSGTMTLAGIVGIPTANYRATVVGNKCTLGISFPATNVGLTQPIVITPSVGDVPLLLPPTLSHATALPILNTGVAAMGSILISPSTITIYSGLNNTGTFSGAGICGIAIGGGQYYYISYLLI